MKWSDENDKVFPAFFAVLGEVTNPKKNADNPFYHSKYTTLEALHAHVKPILKKHKLELSQEPGSDLNGRPTVRNIFYHESGQSGEQSTPYPLILEKETPQGGGSSFTYGCRYTLTGILGIVSEEDDDGNAAESKKQSTTTTNIPRKVPDPKPASKKQLGFIHSLAADLGFTEEDKDELKREAGVASTKDLTSAQAHKIVDDLKARVEKLVTAEKVAEEFEGSEVM